MSYAGVLHLIHTGERVMRRISENFANAWPHLPSQPCLWLGGNKLLAYKRVSGEFALPTPPECQPKFRQRFGFLGFSGAPMRGGGTFVQARNMRRVAQVMLGIWLRYSNLIEQILIGDLRRVARIADSGVMIRQRSESDIGLAAQGNPLRWVIFGVTQQLKRSLDSIVSFGTAVEASVQKIG